MREDDVASPPIQTLGPRLNKLTYIHIYIYTYLKINLRIPVILVPVTFKANDTRLIRAWTRSRESANRRTFGRLYAYRIPFQFSASTRNETAKRTVWSAIEWRDDEQTRRRRRPSTTLVIHVHKKTRNPVIQRDTKHEFSPTRYTSEHALANTHTYKRTPVHIYTYIYRYTHSHTRNLLEIRI